MAVFSSTHGGFDAALGRCFPRDRWLQWKGVPRIVFGDLYLKFEQYLIPWARVGHLRPHIRDSDLGNQLWEWLEKETNEWICSAYESLDYSGFCIVDTEIAHSSRPGSWSPNVQRGISRPNKCALLLLRSVYWESVPFWELPICAASLHPFPHQYHTNLSLGTPSTGNDVRNSHHCRRICGWCWRWWW